MTCDQPVACETCVLPCMAAKCLELRSPATHCFLLPVITPPFHQQQRSYAPAVMGHVRHVLTFALAAILIQNAVAMYTDEDGVVLVTSETFDKHVLYPAGPAMVEFVTPGCGHCQSLAPEYKKVARNLRGIAVVAAVDCSSKASAKICQQHSVKAFPTIKVYEPDKKVNPYTGEPMKEEFAWQGPRTARALSEAVTDTLHDKYITRPANQPELQELLQKEPSLATVLLFTDKSVSTILYKALSIAFAGRLRFAEVRPAAAEVVKAYDVTSYPTLVVVKADGSHQVYEGALKAPPLRAFLEEFAAKEGAGEDASAGGKQGSGDAASGEAGFPGLIPQVHTLAMANLTKIDAEEGMWLIGFYSSAGGACEAQVTAAKKLLVEVQEVVSLGLLDVAGAADLAALAVYGVVVAALQADQDTACSMQWVLFPAGANKTQLEQYKTYKGASEAKALQKWVLDEVPDTTEQVLSMFHMQEFLFKGNPPPRMGADPERMKTATGKVMLVASKEEVPGVYKALAAQLSGKARLLFGWISAPADATAGFGADAMKQLQVKKAPALRMMLPIPPHMVTPEQRAQAAEMGQIPMAMQPYMGPLKFQSMRMWVISMSAMAGLATGPLPGLPIQPPRGEEPLLHHITTQKQVEELCIIKGGLCVLGLAPVNVSSAEEGSPTSRLQSVLTGVAGNFQEQPIEFAVVDASDQPTLRALFGLSGPINAALPAIVALSTKRMRYVVLPPPMTEEGVGKSLSYVLTGSTNSLPLQNMPVYVEGGEKQDAQPEPAEAVDEEFDLSDIMSEEVAGGVLSKEEQLKKIDEELAAQAAAKKAAKKPKSKKKGKGKKKQRKSSTAKDEL